MSRYRKSLSQQLPNYLELMRFDKPIGTYLLLFPTLWALWLANDGFPPVLLLVIFVLGVFFMRSAGCVINDYVDRDIDPNVARTSQRPLADGRVTPNEALGLFGVLIGVSLLLLFLLPNAVWPWAIPAAIITVAYPFMKRFIAAPQAVLGIAFSFSIPMCFVASHRFFDLTFWALFIMNFCWVIVYDTEYAMADRDDDLKLGVKSTAILFGDSDRLVICFLQAIVMIGLLLLFHYHNFSAWFSLVILTVAGLFVYQQYLIRDRQPAACFAAFLNNAWVGVAITLGIFVG